MSLFLRSYQAPTVAQTRHFIKYLLHTFKIQFAPHFIIFSTLLQFAPNFFNLLHTFIICKNVALLQFVPHFYNLLHTFIICSTLLQFAPHFTICSTLLLFAPLL